MKSNKYFSAIAKNKRLASILLGTEASPMIRIGLHLLFWICIFKWFIVQAQWVGGINSSKLYYQIAFQKYFIVIFCFYAVAYTSSLKISNLWIALLVVIIFAITIMLYGITSYLLYNYLNLHYASPDFFKRFLKNISAMGMWTFIRNENVLYYYVEQLGQTLFIPLSIKIFRVTYKANFDKLKLEKDNLILEIDFLKAQINPHFLFNTLNSVYSLIEDKDEVAAHMVHSLSDMMRYSLYQANEKETPVTKELHFITNYIAIQKIRHSKRLTVTTAFNDNIKDFSVPPLLLIDFVENAFKHGADKITKGAWVDIKAAMTAQQEFCFQIINLKPETNITSAQKGIGLINAQRRLKILYPNRHLLDIVETAQTYSVTLKIW